MARLSKESPRGIELRAAFSTEKDETSAPLLTSDEPRHDFDHSASDDDLSIRSSELDSDVERGIRGTFRRFRLGSYKTGIRHSTELFGSSRRKVKVFKLPITLTCCLPVVSWQEITAVLAGIFVGLILVFGIFKGLKHSPSKTFDALAFIDPLIGTAHGGHVFPGANMPYGKFTD
jgi:hypothetical protein